MPITPAVTGLMLLISNTYLAPQWKSETWCTFIVKEISQKLGTGILLYELTKSKNKNSSDPESSEAPFYPPKDPPCSTRQLLRSNCPKRTKRSHSRFKDFEMLN